MEMEIGYIESFRFISSPYQPNLKQQRRKKPAIDREIASHWRPLFKEVRGHQPRVTAQRSASGRKRKAIRHSVARRVSSGWIAFLGPGTL